VAAAPGYFKGQQVWKARQKVKNKSRAQNSDPRISPCRCAIVAASGSGGCPHLKCQRSRSSYQNSHGARPLGRSWLRPRLHVSKTGLQGMKGYQDGKGAHKASGTPPLAATELKWGRRRRKGHDVSVLNLKANVSTLERSSERIFDYSSAKLKRFSFSLVSSSSLDGSEAVSFQPL
jgi:hypothetical protein